MLFVLTTEVKFEDIGLDKADKRQRCCRQSGSIAEAIYGNTEAEAQYQCRPPGEIAREKQCEIDVKQRRGTVEQVDITQHQALR